MTEMHRPSGSQSLDVATTETAAPSVPAPQSDAAEGEMFSLYDRITDAIDGAGTVTIGEGSGFDYPESMLRLRRPTWRPIGEYDDRYVRDVRSDRGRIVFAGDRVLVGVKAGGFEQVWRQRAMAGTVQEVSVVFNGRHHVEVPFHYDGSDGWVFGVVEMPEDLPVRHVTAAEVEKDGALLFSLNLQFRSSAVATRANVNYFSKEGAVVGWATSPKTDVEVFLSVLVDGQEIIIETEGQWNKTDFRQFSCRIPAEAGRLHHVSVRVADDEEAERSPVWYFRYQGDGYMVANPRIVDDHLAISVVGRRQQQAPTMVMLVADGRSASAAFGEPDEAPYQFGERMNTVRLPLDFLSEQTEVRLVGANGRTLGIIPQIDILVTAAREAERLRLAANGLGAAPQT